MREVTCTKVENKYLNIYKSFIDSIKKRNKFFSILENTQVYIINNGQVDIGVILIQDFDRFLDVQIYQAPHVCRLSIISLIETSVVLLKKLDTSKKKHVNFVLLNAQAYAFKFNIIFNETLEIVNDVLYVPIELFNSIEVDKITFRKIKFLDF